MLDLYEIFITAIKKNGLLLFLFSGALLYLTHTNNVQHKTLQKQIIVCNYKYDSVMFKYIELKEDNLYCGLKLNEQNKKIEGLYNLILKLNTTCDEKERLKITKKELPQIFALKDKKLNMKAIN